VCLGKGDGRRRGVRQSSRGGVGQRAGALEGGHRPIIVRTSFALRKKKKKTEGGKERKKKKKISKRKKSGQHTRHGGGWGGGVVSGKAIKDENKERQYHRAMKTNVFGKDHAKLFEKGRRDNAGKVRRARKRKIGTTKFKRDINWKPGGERG